jgi:branched-chain amino acid transport system substrate-binding protein
MPHRVRLLVGLLAGAALTACSSAPLPQALTPEPTASSAAPVLGGTTGTTGATPAAGATGGAAGPGTTGGRPTTGTTGAGATGATGGTTGVGDTTTGPAVVPGLFTPAEDRIGITDKVLRMCAHSALTYGKAFHTDVSDLNVFWDALNAEKGGIFGRKVEMSYENDDYKPETAVTAAATCMNKKVFILQGGIGFDQIPTVRNYVEKKHQLYLYHSATVNGTSGLRYSFSELPTVERLGEGFAQLAAAKYKGKRIAILARDSTNWDPGVTAFKRLAKQYGLNIVGVEKAAASAANYTSQINNLKNVDRAEVVWIWLNALESTEVVLQMRGQNWRPQLMLFPFNLTSQKLGPFALDPVMYGVAMYPAFSKGDYSGPFTSYASDMKEFERQYAKYDPTADISDVGGDLLFLHWTAQKALAEQLRLCGPDCTRNRFVQVLQNYAGIPTPSACPIDFRHSLDGHHGSTYVTFMETYRAPDGKVNWRETRKCVGPA